MIDFMMFRAYILNMCTKLPISIETNKKKNSFLTVLKIKNLKFGTKEPHFAILDSFSRGVTSLAFHARRRKE